MLKFNFFLIINFSKEDSKEVFMQIATLEIDCKLIIWVWFTYYTIILIIFL